MTFRSLTSLTIALTSLASVACGGSSQTDKQKEGTGPTGTVATSGCSPTGDIPCYVGKAEPCENYDSGWAGDEFCMKPPSNGYQLHVGPTDYSNPDEVNKYVLPPGGISATDPRAKVVGSGEPDVNWCYNQKTPNDQPFYSNQYYSHMRPGSHHQIIFALGSSIPDSTAMDDCSSRDQGVIGGATFLAGATRAVQDAAMFGGAPEDARIASETAAHQQVSINLHFVNITDKPLVMEIWVNMIGIDFPSSEVQQFIKAIEWYGGVGMNIPPGTHTTLEAGGQSCQPPEDLRILGVTGHVHASTTRFAMYMQRQGDATKTQVFEDYNWEEPTVFRFNSTTTNAPPVPSSKTPGANVSGQLMVHPGDQFSWECEVMNNRSVNLTFSDRAYDGEMCNVFGMFASANPPGPWSCFSF
jgi:hypothetical protein